MLGKLLLVIITLIMLIISIKYSVKSYKETENELLRILYLILSAFILFPLIIFYIDRYDLPTILESTKNINSKEWLNLIIDHYGSLLAIGLNSLVLVMVTKKQMEDTFEENRIQNKENLRIENLPLLKYNFINETLPDDYFTEHKHHLISNQKTNSCGSLNFILDIKNIGLNSIRKGYIELDTKLLKKPSIIKFSENNSLEKDETIQNEILIAPVKEGNYKLAINIIYEDLLKNWYKQKIELEVNVTRIHSNSIHTVNSYKYKINDEELINIEDYKETLKDI